MGHGILSTHTSVLKGNCTCTSHPLNPLDIPRNSWHVRSKIRLSPLARVWPARLPFRDWLYAIAIMLEQHWYSVVIVYLQEVQRCWRSTSFTLTWPKIVQNHGYFIAASVKPFWMSPQVCRGAVGIVKIVKIIQDAVLNTSVLCNCFPSCFCCSWSIRFTTFSMMFVCS